MSQLAGLNDESLPVFPKTFFCGGMLGRMMISGSLLSMSLYFGEYSSVDEKVLFVSVTVMRSLLFVALVLARRLLLDDLESVLGCFCSQSDGKSCWRGSTSGT